LLNIKGNGEGVAVHAIKAYERIGVSWFYYAESLPC